MMDCARFGLEFNPFLKNSKEILVETAQYREALFRLSYLARTKGFGLLTGGPGRGKTTAVRSFAASLNPSLYKVVYSCLSTLTVSDFYRSLVEALGGQPSFRKPDNFRSIQEEIRRLSLEKKKTPVIIIDEANYVGNAILNDLKLLFNFEMDSRDPAVVLLCGLGQLNNTLRLSVHEPLRQRLVMNFHMEGMTKEEGRDFISTKLAGAGCRHAVFDEAAIEAILNASDGTPRMVCRLCSQSLLCADARRLELVDADTVMQAINDCELG